VEYEMCDQIGPSGANSRDADVTASWVMDAIDVQVQGLGKGWGAGCRVLEIAGASGDEERSGAEAWPAVDCGYSQLTISESIGWIRTGEIDAVTGTKIRR
jgi:hypothetical protein